MPRDPAGTYSYPPGIEGIPDQTIESADYNSFLLDVQQDLNLPRPIVAGGTGAANPDAALDNLSAEKAAQIVTNWDSTVWKAGSYYAATTASGTAPVAGHAFAGTAYYANATDLVLEATDLTDVSDPSTTPQYIRVMTAGVWGAWTKKSATTPIPGMLGEYTFDSGITFPPSSGQVRFNNAVENSTTEVFISHLSALGTDNTGVIPFSLKSGYDFYIQDKDEPAKWKMFTATADPVLSGGDFRITATFKSGGVDVISGQRMLVGANSGASAATYAVRYDVAQTLTAPQQAQARTNIDVAGIAVRYDIAQTLTAAQRAQARSNIDITKKNYIINGAMMVSQENGSTAGTTNQYYPVDQFVMEISHSGISQAQQVTQRTLAGSPNRLAVTVTAPDASVGASDHATITTILEGFRVADLNFGTATAKTITLQFGIKAPAGTYCVSFVNGAANRSYIAEYVIAAGEAMTDVVKSVTIPGDTTGIWATDNTQGMYVRFCFMAGTGFQQAGGSWGTTNSMGTSNQFNFMGTLGNALQLFDVSLTEGSVAPPFMVPDFVSERQLCQRYFQIVMSALQTAMNSGIYYSIGAAPTVPLRSAPTAVVAGNISLAGVNQPFTEQVSIWGCRLTALANTTGTGIIQCTVSFNARL